MEDKESDMALDREDGELEDGELDDDDDTDVMPTLPPALGRPADTTTAENFHKSPPVLSVQGDIDYRKPDTDYRLQSGGGDLSEFGAVEEGKLDQAEYGFNQEAIGEVYGERRVSHDASGTGDSDGSEDESKRRRREKKRDKREKRKRKHEEKRKKKKKYHDFDSTGDQRGPNYKSPDDPYMGGWPGYGSNKRERGPYDSPGSRDGSPEYFERDHKQDPRAVRGYGSPYNSPPGPYDSPDDEDYGDGRRKSKYARLNSTGSHEQESRSMLSMIGDDYFDANVAANEKEELFDRSHKGGGRGGKSQRKIEKSKKYREQQKLREQENAEREHKRREERKRQPCRYYQEGNCPRGDDCEFSHDIPKRELGSKKVLCKHYMRGGCNRDWCVFMHGDYPCKYYFQNRCEMGDDCRFTHGEMSEETRLILDRDEREVSPKRNGQVRKPGQDKPSLLGKQSTAAQSSHGRRNHSNCEPPKYVQETMKKIPSLFDIKVEKPKKPTNQNMMSPNMPAGGPNAMSPNQRGQVRPGFYNDMMGTPPRMSGPGPHGGPPPGAGLLGPAPRPPGMQAMNMPPPGYMGPPPPVPRPGFMAPGNFFGPMGPPPSMMGPMQVKDGQEGQHENKENTLDSGTMQHGHLSSDEWNNQEQGDGWYGNKGDTSEENKTQQQQQQPAKIDLNAMLTMIRNSVVGTASNSPQQNTAPALSTTARDPRSSSIGNDPRATRQDPRAGNRDAGREVDMRTKAPPSEPPAREQTEATFGFAQNQLKAESEKLRDWEKVINCSLSHTGGMPYFLYKITLDVLRPMLPKTVDPTEEKFADDPRVKRYGRIGEPPVDTEPKMIRPRPRQSSVDSTSDLRLKPSNHKIAATPPKAKPDVFPVLPSAGGLDVPKTEEFKAASLPEGLKKPLIPLPKLLDPRLGRQLSMEVERKGEKGQQKSPPASSKPAQPFSHRSDPRFKKKSKGRSNSSGESENLQHQNSNDQIDSLGSGLSPEKGFESDIKNLKTEDSELESKLCSEPPGDQENSEDVEEPLKSGRRDNPMEYASPLGYYSETHGDESYSSYNKKDITNNTDSNKFHFQSDPRSRNRETDENVNSPVNFTDSVTSHMAAVYTPAEDTSYLPMKDMFKTIDPTASPFGSIS